MTKGRKQWLVACGLLLAAGQWSRATGDLSKEPYHILIAGVGGAAVTAQRFLAIGVNQASATEAVAQTPMPVNGIFKELRCTIGPANASDESWDFTLDVNAVASKVTCTVGNSAQTCTDLLNSAPVNVGDLVTINANPTAGAAKSGTPRCSVILYEYF